MDIKRSGSQPSGKGPAEYFTGTVRIDPLFQAPGPARVLGVSVTFEPGARTAWHTHPLGQTLIVRPNERAHKANRHGKQVKVMSNNIEGKVVVITGGSSGLGGAAFSRRRAQP